MQSETTPTTLLLLLQIIQYVAMLAPFAFVLQLRSFTCSCPPSLCMSICAHTVNMFSSCTSMGCLHLTLALNGRSLRRAPMAATTTLMTRVTGMRTSITLASRRRFYVLYTSSGSPSGGPDTFRTKYMWARTMVSSKGRRTSLLRQRNGVRSKFLCKASYRRRWRHVLLHSTGLHSV